MSDNTSLYNYGKLPIISFVTGLLSITIFSFFKLTEWATFFLKTITQTIVFNISLGSILGICLPITAIACGSIDLKKIKKGLHKSKVFKGMDITGIVLGSIILFIVVIFIVADILFSDR